MGINIELRTERGDVVEGYGMIEETELPSFLDLSYPYLRLVDAYGETTFSSYQVEHAVLQELERWVAERPSTAADALLKAAQRCATSVLQYVVLEGD